MNDIRARKLAHLPIKPETAQLVDRGEVESIESEQISEAFEAIEKMF